MAVVIKVLIPSKQAENSQTTQYTSTNVKAVIDKFTATNTSTSSAMLSINIVSSGSSASNSNLILKNRIIAAGETYTCPEVIGHSLESGSFISTISSVANAITIRCSGREFS